MSMIDELDMSECPLGEYPGVQGVAVGLVMKERRAQDKKWGPDRSLTNGKWFKIILEELGEAADSDLEHESLVRTMEEVVQATAVGMAWVEDMLRRRERMLEDVSLERKTFCTDHERNDCPCGCGLIIMDGDVE